MLKNQPVPYQADRLWNKNMVARILEDKRYVEGNAYPSIISTEIFHLAAEKRDSKQSPTQKTTVQKLLGRLCKDAVTVDTESQVLALLNGLIADPQKIQPLPTSNANNARIAEIQRRLDEAMEQQPVDEDTANQLAMQLASARYDTFSASGYETERLQQYFSSIPRMSELDAEALRTSIASIRNRNGKVSITLQNGQVIEMR